MVSTPANSACAILQPVSSVMIWVRVLVKQVLASWGASRAHVTDLKEEGLGLVGLEGDIDAVICGPSRVTMSGNGVDRAILGQCWSALVEAEKMGMEWNEMGPEGNLTCHDIHIQFLLHLVHIVGLDGRQESIWPVDHREDLAMGKGVGIIW